MVKEIQIGKGQVHIQKKMKKNTYSGQGDLELILNRQLLNLSNNTFRLQSYQYLYVDKRKKD